MPLSRELPLLVEPGLTTHESLARDRFLLEAVLADPGRWPAALRVYDLVGEVVSLGRWQVAPPPVAAGIILLRRHSGGRAAACGAGFAGVTLVLPHRGAFLDTTGGPLRPDQVMNRYLRGILGALEAAGVAALYPGRDQLTAGRRQLGIVSFTETAAGAVLVEAILATTGDPSALPRLLDRADPGGVVRAAMLLPPDTTSIAAELGRAPAPDELATWLGRGYAARLGMALIPQALAPDEAARVAALARTAFADTVWLGERGVRVDLDRHASTTTMLGVLEAELALAPDGRIGAVRLSGDVIAEAETIPALEAALQGAHPTRAAVDAAVLGVLADPRHFVLGVGRPDSITDTIMRALA